MKLPLVRWIALSIVATGCASGRPQLVLDTVGPAPEPVAGHSGSASLIVYSAYEATPHFFSRDYYGREYSDYAILDANGALVRKVHNDSGTVLASPARVELNPGQYRVVARANGYGQVTVPVVVAANQNTVVHLDGGGSWPRRSAFNAANAVHLPDGRIVGYKSPAL